MKTQPSPRRGRALAARWARAAANCHKRDVTAEALRLHAPLPGVGWFLYHLENIEFQIIRFRHIPHLRWASRALRLRRRNSFSLFQLGCTRHSTVWGGFLYHLEDVELQIIRFQAHSTGWDGPGPGRGPPPGAAPPGRPWRRFGASSGTGRPS